MWGVAMTKRGHEKRAHGVNVRLPGLRRNQEGGSGETMAAFT